MTKKNRTVTILGENITITSDDFISLTDMLKAKDCEFFISDWLRNRNTVEYSGIWERIHNPDFNYGEFATIKSSAGLNSYKVSVKEWVEKTKLFQQHSVRTHWDNELEKWWFVIVDVVAILTQSTNPQAYWRKLKQRLKAEGNQSVTNCHALKMQTQKGGHAVKQARLEIEKQTGESVISSHNSQHLLHEKMHNPDFNVTEFSNIKNESGSNGFILSSKNWGRITPI